MLRSSTRIYEPVSGLRTNSDSADDEGQEARQDVEARRRAIARRQRENHRGRRRNREDRRRRRSRSTAFIGALPGTGRAPRTSTVSKRSRMRNRKTPMTMKATSTEKATLISTTSGMPLAPAAARISPFSSDMKPTTWLTALRRVTIIRRPSITTERAKARSSRASGSASAVTRSMTTIDSATSAIAGDHGGADADDDSRLRDGCPAGR